MSKRTIKRLNRKGQFWSRLSELLMVLGIVTFVTVGCFLLFGNVASSLASLVVAILTSAPFFAGARNCSETSNEYFEAAEEAIEVSNKIKGLL